MAQPKITRTAHYPTTLEAFSLAPRCSLQTASGVLSEEKNKFNNSLQQVRRAAESCARLLAVINDTEELAGPAARICGLLNDPSISEGAKRSKAMNKLLGRLGDIPGRLACSLTEALKALTAVQRGNALECLSFLPAENPLPGDHPLFKQRLDAQPIEVLVVASKESVPAVLELEQYTEKTGWALKNVLKRVKAPLINDEIFEKEMRKATAALVDSLVEALPAYLKLKIWRSKEQELVVLKDVLNFRNEKLSGALEACSLLLNPDNPAGRDNRKLLVQRLGAALEQRAEQIEAWTVEARQGPAARPSSFSPGQQTALSPLAKEIFGLLFCDEEIGRAVSGKNGLTHAREMSERRAQHLTALGERPAGEVGNCLLQLAAHGYITEQKAATVLTALGRAPADQSEPQASAEELKDAELLKEFLLVLGVKDDEVLKAARERKLSQKDFDLRWKALCGTLNNDSQAADLLVAAQPGLLLADPALFKEFLEKLAASVREIHALSLVDHPHFSFKEPGHLTPEGMERHARRLELYKATGGTDAYAALERNQAALSLPWAQFRVYLASLRDFVELVGSQMATLPEYNPARCPENFENIERLQKLEERFRLERALSQLKLDPELTLEILSAVKNFGQFGNDKLPLPLPSFVDSADQATVRSYELKAQANYRLLCAYNAIVNERRSLRLNRAAEQPPQYTALAQAINHVMSKPAGEMAELIKAGHYYYLQIPNEDARSWHLEQQRKPTGGHNHRDSRSRQRRPAL